MYGIRYDPLTKSSRSVKKTMRIYFPDENYFKIAKDGEDGLPSIKRPLQCVYILSPSMQMCLGHFDNYTTHLTKVYPPSTLHRGTPVRFKFDSKPTVLKRAEWLILKNEPTKYDFILLSVLFQLNDQARSCNLGGGSLSMLCLEECDKCIVRNCFFDSHESEHTSLWLAAFCAMFLHIKTTGILRNVSGSIFAYHKFINIF